VLRTLVEQCVDTLHSLYGAPLRKALEALALLVLKLPGETHDDAERALALALLCATGSRTRATLEASVQSLGCTQIGGFKGDQDAMRVWALM
jgi:hypothetical protein